MRKVVKEFNVYNYSELSAQAKEKVKEWYMEGQNPYFLQDTHEEYLNELFPKSDLKVQFDFSCSQGSGYNIYGSLDAEDLLNYLQEKEIDTGLTEKEIKAIKWYNKEGYLPITLRENSRYTYFCQSLQTIIDDVKDTIEWVGIRNIRYNAIAVICGFAYNIMQDICNKFYNNGYNYFYVISDKDLAEICDVNNWEFTEDGKLY